MLDGFEFSGHGRLGFVRLAPPWSPASLQPDRGDLRGSPTRWPAPVPSSRGLQRQRGISPAAACPHKEGPRDPPDRAWAVRARFAPMAPVRQDLRDLVLAAARNVGRSQAEAEPFAKHLAEHWFDRPESLVGCRPQELTVLGIPLRFAEQIIVLAENPELQAPPNSIVGACLEWPLREEMPPRPMVAPHSIVGGCLAWPLREEMPPRPMVAAVAPRSIVGGSLERPLMTEMPPLPMVPPRSFVDGNRARPPVKSTSSPLPGTPSGPSIIVGGYRAGPAKAMPSPEPQAAISPPPKPLRSDEGVRACSLKVKACESNFQCRALILGTKGHNLHRIEAETGVKVDLRGEVNEGMDMERAVQMGKDLLCRTAKGFRLVDLGVRVCVGGGPSRRASKYTAALVHIGIAKTSTTTNRWARDCSCVACACPLTLLVLRSIGFLLIGTSFLPLSNFFLFLYEDEELWESFFLEESVRELHTQPPETQDSNDYEHKHDHMFLFDEAKIQWLAPRSALTSCHYLKQRTFEMTVYCNTVWPYQLDEDGSAPPEFIDVNPSLPRLVPHGKVGKSPWRRDLLSTMTGSSQMIMRRAINIRLNPDAGGDVGSVHQTAFDLEIRQLEGAELIQIAGYDAVLFQDNWPSHQLGTSLAGNAFSGHVVVAVLIALFATVRPDAVMAPPPLVPPRPCEVSDSDD